MKPLLTCMTIAFVGASVWGQTATSDALIPQLVGTSNDSAVTSAFIALGKSLRSTDTNLVNDTRGRLCQQLSATTDPVVTKRIARLLAAAPCDQAMEIALSKLDQASTPQVREAACELIYRLNSGGPPQSQALIDSAISALGSLLRDDSQPARVLDSALLGMAAMGPKGLDAMLKARNAAGPVRKASNVFYSALACTGDPRALAFLRDALADAGIHDGLRIQAVHAMGELAARLAARGQVIAPSERDACIRTLSWTVGTTLDDQMFGVALQSLARFTTPKQNESLRSGVLAGLASKSSIRQESALQTLFLADCHDLDSNLIVIVRTAAQFGDTNCQPVAEAILSKCDLDSSPPNRLKNCGSLGTPLPVHEARNPPPEPVDSAPPVCISKVAKQRHTACAEAGVTSSRYALNVYK